MNEITPEYLAHIARQSHEIACSKGWWGDDASPDTLKTNERNFGEILMLATSELAEALEHYRDAEDAPSLLKIWWCQNGSDANATSETPIPGGKPDGFPIELADTVIRLTENIQALLGPKTLSLFQAICSADQMKKAIRQIIPAEDMYDEPPKSTNVPERLKQIDVYITGAYTRLVELDGPGAIDFEPIGETIDGPTVRMAKAILETFSLANDLNLDLKRAIAIKAEYNSTRPYRHGGRKA